MALSFHTVLMVCHLEKDIQSAQPLISQQGVAVIIWCRRKTKR